MLLGYLIYLNKKVSFPPEGRKEFFFRKHENRKWHHLIINTKLDWGSNINITYYIACTIALLHQFIIAFKFYSVNRELC